MDIEDEMAERIRAQALWDELDQMTKEAVGFGAVKKVLGMFKAAPKKPVLSPVEQMAKKFMADPRALKSVGPRRVGQTAAELRISEAHGARPGRKYAAMRAEIQDLAEKHVKVVPRQHDIVEAELGSIHLTKTSFPVKALARGAGALLRRGGAAGRQAGKAVSGLGRGQGPVAGAGPGAIRGVSSGAHQAAMGRFSRRAALGRATEPFKAVGRAALKPAQAVGRGVQRYGKAGLLAGGLAVGGTAIGASSLLRQHAQQQMGRTITPPYRGA